MSRIEMGGTEQCIRRAASVRAREELGHPVGEPGAEGLHFSATPVLGIKITARGSTARAAVAGASSRAVAREIAGTIEVADSLPRAHHFGHR